MKLKFLILIFLVSTTLHAQTARYVDLRYADGYAEAHLLDLEVPESPVPVPLVVFVHGGGWANGDKACNRDKATMYAAVRQSTFFSRHQTT